ncbi:hypothetical protein [uncultured Nostoc sp.]|uniref:hypothetical protein n=1 Tax=Nostoc sp. TaxID=1180 RepID=UPI001DACAB9D|nr:hypothetical protein [Nostoc sp. JL23]
MRKGFDGLDSTCDRVNSDKPVYSDSLPNWLLHKLRGWEPHPSYKQFAFAVHQPSVDHLYGKHGCFLNGKEKLFLIKKNQFGIYLGDSCVRNGTKKS